MFTSTQRGHLHSISLSRIICDNSHITQVPVNPFSRTESLEDMLACSHPLIPHLDLSPWKEPDTGEVKKNKKKPVEYDIWVFYLTASPSDPSCGPIPRIQSGYSLLCNSVILYECHSGFKLLGSSSVSCDLNSQQWSSTPPTCQGTEKKVRPGNIAGIDQCLCIL